MCSLRFRECLQDHSAPLDICGSPVMSTKRNSCRGSSDSDEPCDKNLEFQECTGAVGLTSSTFKHMHAVLSFTECSSCARHCRKH